MKRLVFISLLSALWLCSTGVANAHQPVELGSKNTRADQGPILVDGTVSFALRANFTKANQERGFRVSLKQGELLNFEYLIIDKAPENKMALNKLPTVTITAPDGAKSIVKFTERTKFYEPYGRTNYLYLARFSSTALDGIYNFSIKSKAKAMLLYSSISILRAVPNFMFMGIKFLLPESVYFTLPPRLEMFKPTENSPFLSEILMLFL